MDRSWRERVETEGTSAEDPGLSRWQKFIRGGYTINAVTGRFAQRLALRQKKTEYLENLIVNKGSYEDERDLLLLKQLEIKVLNTFNMYRIPFVVCSFGVCLFVLFNTRMSLHFRLLPTLFLGTFSSMYNYHVGQYGLYRNLDGLYAFLLAKGETRVAREAREYLERLQSEEDERLAHRRELRRRREEGQAGLREAVEAVHGEKKNEAEAR